MSLRKHRVANVIHWRLVGIASAFQHSSLLQAFNSKVLSDGIPLIRRRGPVLPNRIQTHSANQCLPLFPSKHFSVRTHFTIYKQEKIEKLLHNSDREIAGQWNSAHDLSESRPSDCAICSALYYLSFSRQS